MLDELLVGGELQESSKRNIIRAVTAQDMLQEVRLRCRVLTRCAIRDFLGLAMNEFSRCELSGVTLALYYANS